jgi:phosphotransferase system HPr (HPr) family protein
MMRRQMQLIVGNERGVHGRVAKRLAEIAAEFGVIVHIRRGEEIVECSSILDVLALALVQGTAITVLVEGAQADAALASAASLLTTPDDP